MIKQDMQHVIICANKRKTFLLYSLIKFLFYSLIKALEVITKLNVEMVLFQILNYPISLSFAFSTSFIFKMKGLGLQIVSLVKV